MIGSQAKWEFWAVPWVLRITGKGLLQRQFFWNESISKLEIERKFIVFYIKLLCICKLLVDHKFAAFHQVFSWISVGPSKCPIEKLIKLTRTFTVLVDQSLEDFHQLYSWTSLGSRNIKSTKWVVFKVIWQSKQFLEYPVISARGPSKTNFKKIKFSKQRYKNFSLFFKEH